MAANYMTILMFSYEKLLFLEIFRGSSLNKSLGKCKQR